MARSALRLSLALFVVLAFRPAVTVCPIASGRRRAGGRAAADAQRSGLRSEPQPGAAARRRVHGRARGAVKIGDYFGKRPVVLSFVYYGCPMLCLQSLSSLAATLGVLSENPGEDFEVVSISIDPRETPSLALEKKAHYVQRSGKPSIAKGWHFLTGTEQTSSGSRAPPASATCGTSRRSNMCTRPASSSRRRKGRSRAICSASTTARAICVSRCSTRGRENQLSARAGAALLLSLRPGDGPLQPRDHARRAAGRRRHGLFTRHADLRLDETRAKAGRVRHMFGIPLFPERASTIANEVDALYFFLVGLLVVMSVLIATLVVSFAIRFRRRHAGRSRRAGSRRADARARMDRHAVHHRDGDLLLGREGLLRDGQPAAGNAEHLRRRQAVDVEGAAPTGQREINQLHVPVGRPVKLIMTSEDVIHDFSIPAMRVKADVIPGRFVQIWFEPTTPGTYQIFCAEYCGTQHSRMTGQVVVMEANAYQTWLSGGTAEGSLASTGEKLFADLACNTCHRPDSRGRGPVLQNLYSHPVQLHDGTMVTADENYLRESILTPAAKVTAGFQPVMPAFQGLVSEEQLLALIEYVKSLSAQQENVNR